MCIPKNVDNFFSPGDVVLTHHDEMARHVASAEIHVPPPVQEQEEQVRLSKIFYRLNWGHWIYHRNKNRSQCLKDYGLGTVPHLFFVKQPLKQLGHNIWSLSRILLYTTYLHYCRLYYHTISYYLENTHKTNPHGSQPLKP